MVELDLKTGMPMVFSQAGSYCLQRKHPAGTGFAKKSGFVVLKPSSTSIDFQINDGYPTRCICRPRNTRSVGVAHSCKTGSDPVRKEG
jgi:hypothetical protein